jgi:hypothetical protein
MDFFNLLKTLDDRQIKEVVAYRIAEEKAKSEVNKKNYIGIDCGVNPKFTLGEKPEDESKTMWVGYIPENIKVVYKYDDYKGFTVNNGGYYYMDDSLVYEFCLYAKNKKADNYLELLDLIWSFAEHYFDSFDPNFTERCEMLYPVLKNEGWFFEPTIEHNIKMFKGRNNALCSEYSAVAQNIMSVFGYQSMYFIGSVKCEYGTGPHAYNISIVEGHPLLLDYTIPVRTYDMKGNVIAYSPYAGIINGFSADYLLNVANNKEPMNFPEYDLYLMGDKVRYHEKETTRYYAIGDIKFFEKNPNYQKNSNGLQKKHL